MHAWVVEEDTGMRRGVPHAGECGISGVPPALSVRLYVSPYPVSCLPVVPPCPPPSHARVPHPLPRHRPPPRAQGPQAGQSPPPTPQIHAMLLVADL